MKVKFPPAAPFLSVPKIPGGTMVGLPALRQAEDRGALIAAEAGTACDTRHH